MVPITLKIENFFSHKESIINFDDFDSAILIGNVDGNYDISNGSGKSAILEAILWCLFNKSRAAVIDDVIKWGENEALVTFIFKHKGEIYRVKRTRCRTTGLSSVEFHIMYDNNMWKDLTGATSGITNDNIVSVIKIDYKTFTNSAYFRQNDISEFAESDPGRKKDILKRIIDVSKWDEYEKISKDNVRSLRISRDEQAKLSDGLEEVVVESKNTKKKLDIESKNIIVLSDERTKIASGLEDLTEKYSIIRQGLDTDKWDIIVDENYALSKKTKVNDLKLIKLKKIISKHSLSVAKIDKERDKLQSLLDQIVFDKGIKDKLQATNLEIANLTAEVSSNRERVLEVESLNFGKELDECYVCGQKVTEELKDKILNENQEKIDKYKSRIIYLKNRLNQEKISLIEFKDVERNNQKVIAARDRINAINLEQSTIQRYLEEAQEEFRLKNVENENISYKITTNNAILSGLRNDDFKALSNEIEQLKNRRGEVNSELEKKNREIGILTQKTSEYVDKIKQMEKAKKNLGALEKRLAVCEKITKMFGKNGIQTILLNAVIEDLEVTSNDILSEICNEPFLIMLETQRLGADGVSIVDTLDLKVKKDGVIYNFKSLSGGEQFRVSLALRIALSEISSRHGGSSLEFLLLDEINSPLDRHGTENLFVNVIKSLEKKYKILLITHNDALKERFDNVIDVTKINGESFVKFIAK